MISRPRRFARHVLRELSARHAKPYESWASSAIVFAPHQDDETLGCGGTIAKKCRQGADVRVTFMTDGSQSHAGRMAAGELRDQRCEEALAACRVLGVPAGATSFLALSDGTLDREFEAARRKVGELLVTHRPEEVFVPFHADAQPDHVATNRIVLAALSDTGHRARVLEYPVWFWYHWPWVSFSRSDGGVSRLLAAVAADGGLPYRQLSCAADVREVMDLKRQALHCHGSQMRRPDGDATWPILSDVSDGDWLACFFFGHELFHCYWVGAT